MRRSRGRRRRSGKEPAEEFFREVHADRLGELAAIRTQEKEQSMPHVGKDLNNAAQKISPGVSRKGRQRQLYLGGSREPPARTVRKEGVDGRQEDDVNFLEAP